MDILDGQVTVMTGAGRGLGVAGAPSFAREGSLGSATDRKATGRSGVEEVPLSDRATTGWRVVRVEQDRVG